MKLNLNINRVETVTPDTMIGDLVFFHPQTADLLFSIGMHCLGCPSSGIETIRQAAEIHGVETDKLVSQLNLVIKKQHAEGVPMKR